MCVTIKKGLNSHLASGDKQPMQPEECMDCGEEMVPGGAAHCLRHCERWLTQGPDEKAMILNVDISVVAAVQQSIPANHAVATTDNDS